MRDAERVRAVHVVSASGFWRVRNEKFERARAKSEWPSSGYMPALSVLPRPRTFPRGVNAEVEKGPKKKKKKSRAAMPQAG